MELQIGILDMVALGITAIFATKGNKLKLSKLLLMAIIIVFAFLIKKAIDLNTIQFDDTKSTFIIIGFCLVCFMAASLLESMLDKAINFLISPSLHTLLGVLISTFIGIIVASMVCLLAVKAQPTIKITPITEFYLNIAGVVVKVAPEVKQEFQEKAAAVGSQLQNVDQAAEQSDIPSDIGKTIEDMQSK